MIVTVKICESNIYSSYKIKLNPKALTFVDTTPLYFYVLSKEGNFGGSNILTPIKGYHFGYRMKLEKIPPHYQLFGVKLKSTFFKKNPKNSYFYNLDLLFPIPEFDNESIEKSIERLVYNCGLRFCIPKSWELVNHPIDMYDKDTGLLISALKTSVICALPIRTNEILDIVNKRNPSDVALTHLFRYIHSSCNIDPKSRKPLSYAKTFMDGTDWFRVNKYLIRSANILTSHFAQYFEKPLDNLESVVDIINR